MSDLFPEEPLDSPLGYFDAYPGRTRLKGGGGWLITRKLGQGPRSSTWLIKDPDNAEDVHAIKIFTVEATAEDASITREIEFLKILKDSRHVPYIVNSFFEESTKGKHFCLILQPLGESIEAFRLRSTSGLSLPAHLVQKIVKDTLGILCDLEKANIIHGELLPENLFFGTLNSASSIYKILEAFPLEYIQEITTEDGTTYPAPISQPLPNNFKSKSSPVDFSDSEIYLNNFRHAHRVTGKEITLDCDSTLLPPEALLGGKVSVKVNTWMLGCITFLLLTGTSLFSGSYVETPSKVLAEVISTLADLLVARGMASADSILAASFIKSCLALDPVKRPRALDLLSSDKWIKGATVCSCGFCG